MNEVILDYNMIERLPRFVLINQDAVSPYTYFGRVSTRDLESPDFQSVSILDGDRRAFFFANIDDRTAFSIAGEMIGFSGVPELLMTILP